MKKAFILSLFSLVVFFFSSRRRHTRWNCDWSSDVCSSDLKRALVVVEPVGGNGGEDRALDLDPQVLERRRLRDQRLESHQCLLVAALGEQARSEEHTSELQSQFHLVCRLLLEKKNKFTLIS